MELFFAALIFVSSELFAFQAVFTSESAMLLNFVITALFISMAIVFVLFFREAEGTPGRRMHRIAIHAMFIAIVAAYLLLFVTNIAIWVTLLKNFWIFGVFFTAFLPLFFMTFIGAYLVRSGNRQAAVLLLVVLLVLVLYYPSQVLASSFRADDEELIMFQGLNTTLHGGNPYGTSYYDVIYQNIKSTGFTLTTNMGGIMSNMAYPTLFFLSFLPFYLSSAPTMQNFLAVDLPVQESVFLFILMVTMAFLMDKKDTLMPNLPLMVLFIFVLTNSASITVYLMIALLLVAYVKLDSKYSWFFLGVCASIQEELWLPVMFLIAYSFNNQGSRKGLINVIGAAAVFLAFNAYFIALSPSAYYGSVFGTLNSYIFPNGFSGIGFPLLRYYPVLLSVFPQIFEVTALFLAFLFLYWNRKELALVFSMIPFLALDHSLYSYCATFMLVLVFVVSLKDNKKKAGSIEAYLKRRKALVYCVIVAYIALVAFMLYSSHAAYESSFGMSMGNPTLTLDKANMTSVYRATLSYGNVSNNTVYVIGAVLNNNLFFGFFGLFNDSIISNPANCSTKECSVNVNRIMLPRNSSTYDLVVKLKWYNETTQVRQAAVELYNGKYFFMGKTAYNNTP